MNHKEGKGFNEKDFLEHPMDYENVFPKKYLPYLTIFINAIAWSKPYPFLISTEEIKHTF